VTAARHQVDEADLVHLAQVRTFDDGAGGDDALDVELEPVDVSHVEFADQPVSRRAVGPIADEPRAVGELHDRANLVESRRLGGPADARQAGEVGVIGLVPEGQSAGRGAQAGPHVNRVVLVTQRPGQLNLLGRAAIEFQFQRSVGHRLLRDRMLVVGRRLLPLLAEEESRPCDARGRAAASLRRR
jgi:hypothetical protein